MITLVTFPCHFLIGSLLGCFTEFRLFILDFRGFWNLSLCIPLRRSLALPAPDLYSLCLILSFPFHCASCPLSHVSVPFRYNQSQRNQTWWGFSFKLFLTTGLLYGLLSIRLGGMGRQEKSMSTYFSVQIYIYV